MARRRLRIEAGQAPPWPGDAPMPYATAHGARIYYEEVGEGTPLLFLARIRWRPPQLAGANASVRAGPALYCL